MGIKEIWSLIVSFTEQLSDTELYLFIAYSCIAQAGTCYHSRWNAKRYHELVEPDMDEAKRNKKLPKVIRKHFGLRDRAVQFTTLNKYVYAYCQFWLMFILPVLALVLKPSHYLLAFIVLIIIEAIWGTLLFIFFQIPASYYATKHKEKTKRQTFKELWQEFIYDMRFLKEFFIELFTREDDRVLEIYKDIDKIAKHRKKNRYISKENLDYFEKTVYPKYQKRFTYEIVSEDKKTNVLEIYLKRKNKRVMQVYIEKD